MSTTPGDNRDPDPVAELATRVERELVATYGARLTGRRLYQALGFSGAAAFRQAIARGHVGVALHPIENRGNGRYALCSDIAKWLAVHRLQGVRENPASLAKREHLSKIRKLRCPRTEPTLT